MVTSPRGLYPPYFVRGGPAVCRAGSTNRQATHAEIRRLYLLSGETSYETLPCRTAALADLSSRLMPATETARPPYERCAPPQRRRVAAQPGLRGRR